MIRILPMFAGVMLAAMAADLPVREVVLYKSGVGYFDRAGRLAPGESARLDFKAREMNDVLKSLTVEDNAGKITGLRYDSSEPLAEKLSDFSFSVGGSQSLSAFLDQLKGARIELKYGPETIAGIIVSARTVKPDEKAPEREQVVLMLDSGELRTLDLGGGRLAALCRRETANRPQGLSRGADAVAVEGQAQRLYRFVRRQGPAGLGHLYAAHAGVEVELPAGL